MLAPGTREDLKIFFGPRSEAYLKFFDATRDNASGNKRMVWSFSWPAFLCSFVWFFYRRLYIWGAAVLLLPIIVGEVFGGTGTAGMWGGIAVIAKLLYVSTGIARIQKANALQLTGEARADYLRRAGGVSTVAGVIAGLFFALAVVAFIVTTFFPELLQ